MVFLAFIFIVMSTLHIIALDHVAKKKGLEFGVYGVLVVFFLWPVLDLIVLAVTITKTFQEEGA